MLQEINKIIKFQKITNVKCVHNELKIIFEIACNGPLESMKIMKKTGSSISGHNEDIKRLYALKIIELVDSSIDKRKRVYDITTEIKNIFAKIS